MNMISHLILAAIGLFAATNVVVEYRNRKTLPVLSNPMSSYLAGHPLTWLQDAGFLIFAIVLPVVAYGMHKMEATEWVYPILYISSLALIGVVATKLEIDDKPRLQSMLEKYHVLCAGAAFTGTTLALLLATYHIGGIAFGAALAAPISALLFYRFAPGKTAIEEKVYTILLLVSLTALFV